MFVQPLEFARGRDKKKRKRRLLMGAAIVGGGALGASAFLLKTKKSRRFKSNNRTSSGLNALLEEKDILRDRLMKKAYSKKMRNQETVDAIAKINYAVNGLYDAKEKKLMLSDSGNIRKDARLALGKGALVGSSLTGVGILGANTKKKKDKK